MSFDVMILTGILFILVFRNVHVFAKDAKGRLQEFYISKVISICGTGNSG